MADRKRRSKGRDRSSGNKQTKQNKNKKHNKNKKQNKHKKENKKNSSVKVPKKVAANEQAVRKKTTAAQTREKEKNSLGSHASYIDAKLELIPAKFYFPAELDENQWKQSKFSQNVKGKAPKQGHKSSSKRGLKIAKFREENMKSIHEELKVRIIIWISSAYY